MKHAPRASLILSLSAMLLLCGCGDKQGTESASTQPTQTTSAQAKPTQTAKPAQPKLPVASDPNHPLNDANLSARASNASASLQLEDKAKAERINLRVLLYLQTLRAWSLQHPASDIPAGINPANGRPISIADREYIQATGTPIAFLKTFIDSLNKELTPKELETLFDTMTGFTVPKTKERVREIVPDLTDKEMLAINTILVDARSRALLILPPKQMKRHFEIILPQIKDHLNQNGRNWSDLVAAAQLRRAKETGKALPPQGPKQAPKR